MTAGGPSISPELARELAAIAAGQGCELARVEFKGGVLRLILDRLEGGVNLADCEAVSKQASALLDVTEFGDRRYTLEVSSPGLDRELYGPRDYQRFQGRAVRVTFLEPEGGAKRTVTGRLSAFRPGEGPEGDAPGGVIEVVPVEGRDTLEIPLDRIKLARLEIEL